MPSFTSRADSSSSRRDSFAYPSEGLEFAIRRAKIPGRTWKMRLWASGIVNGEPGATTFPAGAPERSTDGWLELRLR